MTIGLFFEGEAWDSTKRTWDNSLLSPSLVRSFRQSANEAALEAPQHRLRTHFYTHTLSLTPEFSINYMPIAR